MNVEDFQDLLDAYGPDLNAWQDGEREVAERLLEDSPEARRRLASAWELEARLHVALLPAPVPPGLREAVLQVPRRHPRASRLSAWGWGMRFAWGGSFGAVLASGVLGFVLGAGLLSPGDDPLESVDVVALVYGAEEDLP